MKYLIDFSTEQLAVDRSEKAAIDRGCHGDVTKYWFSWMKHPTLTEWALYIPESEEDLLTAGEISALKTREYMDEQGWFPNPFPPQ